MNRLHYLISADECVQHRLAAADGWVLVAMQSTTNGTIAKVNCITWPLDAGYPLEEGDPLRTEPVGVNLSAYVPVVHSGTFGRVVL